MTKENLGRLILESERQMYLTAKTILRNDQDCGDAIQEAIVKAFQKIDTLRQDKYAKTWLMRICVTNNHITVRNIPCGKPHAIGRHIVGMLDASRCTQLTVVEQSIVCLLYTSRCV